MDLNAVIIIVNPDMLQDNTIAKFQEFLDRGTYKYIPIFKGTVLVITHDSADKVRDDLLKFTGVETIIALKVDSNQSGPEEPKPNILP